MKQLLAYPGILDAISLYLSIAASSALVRVIFSPQPKFVSTFSVWVGSSILGTIVGFGVHSIEAWSSYDILATIAFGLAGKELLRSMLKVITQLESNPFQTISKIIALFKPKKEN